MMMQSVCVAVASLDQSWAVRSLPGLSVPVMKATLEERSRWVSEMPAYAADPEGDGMPGTISKGIFRVGEGLDLFGPPGEKKRIAPLQSGNDEPLLGEDHQLGVDGLLREKLSSPYLLPTLRNSAPGRA